MNNFQAHVLLTLFDPDCKIEERIKTEIKNVFLSVPLQQWEQTSPQGLTGFHDLYQGNELQWQRTLKKGAGFHYFFKWKDLQWYISRHERRNKKEWIWILCKEDDFVIEFTFASLSQVIL